MSQIARDILNEIETVILGKPQQVTLSLACLLANGHLLIEDLPGMGKTTLAHALAKALGLEYQRIQFTSDLLPSDVTGTNIYDRNSGQFEFKPGAVFTQLLLADELNRATPKAQSALLEAMEERQVSLDGHTKALPEHFFVIATQNPSTQSGTFPLPESQLDRFLMCLSLGYPDAKSELALLTGQSGRGSLAKVKQVVDQAKLGQMKAEVEQVRVAQELVAYLYRLIEYSRRGDVAHLGLSTRAGLGLLAASKAFAYLQGRDFVVPEDVQAVFVAVAGHRLVSREMTGEACAKHILAQVAVVNP